MVLTKEQELALHPTLGYLPGGLPNVSISPDTDCKAVIATFLATHWPALPPPSWSAESFYRDQFAFSGTLRTFHSAASSAAAWNELSKDVEVGSITVVKDTERVIVCGKGQSFVECMIEFETGGNEINKILAEKCLGFINLVPEGGEWKLWCLQTILEEFTGFESVDLRKMYPNVPTGRDQDAKPDVSVSTITHTISPLLSPISRAPTSVSISIPDSPLHVDTLVVGAGQSGLCNAAYLKSLGISYLIVERNEEVGDNWKLRYGSLKLHTPHAFNNLAFGPTFTIEDGYNEWLTKDEMARAYREYAEKFELNVWRSSSIISCGYDKSASTFTVEIDHAGRVETITCKFMILACGPGGTVPLKPTFRDEDVYKGDLVHSADWKNAENWKGKKGIVIGTANTAHDVAEDMLTAGMDVTMLQRSHTFVLPRDFFTAFFDFVWPHGRSQETSDRYFWSPPTAVVRLETMNYLWPMIDADHQRFDDLEKTGFKVDRRGDFTNMLLVRFGGHFMDHGTSAKISGGKIKVKSDALPVAYTATGLEFEDGSNLDADLIVYATGFEKDAKFAAQKIVGYDIAAQLDDFWGCDEEGEVKGAFKPCGHPGIFMTGGGCAHARYWTRYVAMQIKADLLGKPLRVYSNTP